jgi:hypothetical protein
MPQHDELSTSFSVSIFSRNRKIPAQNQKMEKTLLLTAEATREGIDKPEEK